MSTRSPESLITNRQENGVAYAWGKTARLITEDHYLETIDSTQGDFVAVDLCSSFPFFPQILRERLRDNCLTQATKIAGQLIDFFNRHHKPKPTEASVFAKLAPNIARELRQQIGPRDSNLRQLITASILDLLFSPPVFEQEDGEEQRQRLENIFIDKLYTSQVAYKRIFEREELKGRGRWEIIVPEHLEVSAKSEIEKIVNPTHLEEVIREIARFVSGKCLPRLRKFMVVSLDIESPEKLLQEAVVSFPLAITTTEFYRRAAQLSSGPHIRADILNVPFRPKSVSFYSCIEGWPFYFGNNSLGEHLRFAVSIYETLKEGGKAVFFPWFKRDDQEPNHAHLEQVLELWRSLGMNTTTQTYTRQELYQQMRDREQMLTDRSPVFSDSRNEDTFVAVIVHKPLVSGNVPGR